MSAFAPPDDFAAAAFAKWTKTPGADSEVYLVYGGATGWLGGLLVTLLKDSGKTVHIGEARLENREAILRDFEKHAGSYDAGPPRTWHLSRVTGLRSGSTTCHAARKMLGALMMYRPLETSG